jgi:hypothetical protein
MLYAAIMCLGIKQIHYAPQQQETYFEEGGGGGVGSGSGDEG